MSEAKHTPGTWEIDAGDPGDSSVGLPLVPPSIVSLIDDGDPVTICVLYEPGRYCDRAQVNEFDECMEYHGTIEGNGRLIKAAPELLESLEQFIHIDDSGVEITPAMWNAAITRARDAIAKATATKGGAR